MQFARKLRSRVSDGEITRSIRIWRSPRVKVGNSYRMAEGWVVVDRISQIEFDGITPALARETGFAGIADLLKTAKHGAGENV